MNRAFCDKSMNMITDVRYTKQVKLAIGLSQIPPVVFVAAIFKICSYFDLHNLHNIVDSDRPMPLSF